MKLYVKLGATDTVTNHDFETGDFTGWTNILSTMQSGGAGAQGFWAALCARHVCAPGTYWNGSISQTLKTPIDVDGITFTYSGSTTSSGCLFTPLRITTTYSDGTTTTYDKASATLPAGSWSTFSVTGLSAGKTITAIKLEAIAAACRCIAINVNPRVDIIAMSGWLGIDVEDIIFQVARGGKGYATITIQDEDLSNLDRFTNYLKLDFEIREDDGTTVIFEGTFTNLSTTYNTITLEGREYISKALGCKANYNPIQLTGILNGAVNDRMIDWGSNPFGGGPLSAAYQAKHVAFVERTLNEAHFYPNDDSDWYLSDGTTPFTPTVVVGNLTNMTLSVDRSNTWTGADNALDDWYQQLEFTILVKSPDTAPDSFTFTWDAFLLDIVKYITSPQLEIYDYNLATWEVWKVFSVFAGYGYLSNDFSGEISKTSSISDYLSPKIDTVNGFNRYTLKLRFYCGNSGFDIEINTVIAELKCVFSNSQAITLGEGYTAISGGQNRTMTLLDDANYETADEIGITKADSYIIGTNMKTAMDAMWSAHDISAVLSLTFDATTIGSDFTDRTNESLLGVLQQYAKILDRDIWQLHDGNWDAKCSKTYTASGLTLTEADVHNVNVKGAWSFVIDTNNLYKTVYVIGQTEVITGSQAITPEFTTIEELVVNDPKILSTSGAAEKADGLQYLHTNAARELTLTLDLSKTGADYSAVKLMREISVNLWTGTIQVVDYIIDSITYQQQEGGHLFATLHIVRRDHV